LANSFFEKINYSACNEDSESERKALCLTSDDTVLCITGSGARPLDLLIDSPKKIISVDFNATQNYLLLLKIAAYKSLNYAEFKSFIGLESNFTRKELYNKLINLLSIEAKSYWDKHFNLIENGLLYCGTWELFLRTIAKAAFFRGKSIKKLMASETLKDQQVFWTNHWNNAVWRFFLKLISNRFLWTKIVKEPGALLIPQEFDVYEYMSSRMNHLANTHLLRKNHFANLLFYGEYQPDCLLPIHLREENFEGIKNQVHKIEIITDSLLNVLDDKTISESITAYSLSDFSSYADTQIYDEIWTKIINNANHEIKFCERFFLVKRNPETLNKRIERENILEQQLCGEDLSAIYTFCVGKVKAGL
jgi:S-adenosylmethionine-diacylglycerol 3-amino-3-carboxypropyl transferase